MILNELSDYYNTKVDYLVLVNDSNNIDAILDRICERGLKIAATFVPEDEYYWHREKFNLTKVRGELKYLFGSTEVGESIEDGWTIVSILYSLSKEFPDAFLRIDDTYGEFLLIEAAYELPDWIQPEISKNRVWIRNGEIWIIPEFVQPDNGLTLLDAINYVKNNNNKGHFYHDESIDKVAFNQIHLFDEQNKKSIISNIHRARVVTSRKVASFLHMFPQYIVFALEELFDPINGSKDIEENNYFKAEEDFVDCTIKFPKRSYARLSVEKFDRIEVTVEEDEEPLEKFVQLGTKLIGALMYLFDSYLKDDVKMITEDDLNEDDGDNSEFYECLDKMMEIEYPKGRGSRPSGDSESFQLFKESVVQVFLSTRKVYNEVLNKDLCNDFKKFLKVGLATDEEVKTWDKTIDSEEWLNVELDEEKDSNGFDETQIDDIKDKLEKFLMAKSGLEGIDEDDDDDDDDDDEEEEEEEEEVEKGGYRGGDESGKYKEKKPSSRTDELLPDDFPEDFNLEDDFFEFFCTTALKLTPEQLESFRSNEDHGSSRNTDYEPTGLNLTKEQKDDFRKLFTEGSKILDDSDNRDTDGSYEDFGSEDGDDDDELELNRESIKAILDSALADGGLAGPAASLLRTLGVMIPPTE